MKALIYSCIVALGLYIPTISLLPPAEPSNLSYTIIQQPRELTVACAVIPLSRREACDASVTAEIKGGKAPYKLKWSNGGTFETIRGLCEGSYSVTITDAAGTVATCTTQVLAPKHAPLIMKGVFYKKDGQGYREIELGVLIYSGTPPYSYEWSDGSTGYHIKNAKQGEYKVKVTDASQQSDNCYFKVTGDTVIVECKNKNF